MPASPDMLITGKPIEVLTNAAPKLIYGAIVLSAVIAPIRLPPPPSMVVIALSVFSLLAIGVAGAYADIVRNDMRTQEITPWRVKGRMLLTPSWVIAPSAAPVLCFGLAILGAITPEQALAMTKGLLIFILVFFGFIARRLCGGGWWVSVVNGLAVGLLGVVVIQIKVWIKYLPEIYL